MLYKFRIDGNQENKFGNPIPYFRSTQKSQWSKGAKRYESWKTYVRFALLDASATILPHKEFMEMKRMIATGSKPLIIPEGYAGKMDIKIFWANEAHADCDNVFKGIADALFVNDKHLHGSFEPVHNDKGYVLVEIAIYKSNN